MIGDQEAMAAVDRARSLHQQETCVGIALACVEGECSHPSCHDGGESPEVEFQVCRHCYGIARDSGLTDEFMPDWAMYPCATVTALDSGPQADNPGTLRVLK